MALSQGTKLGRYEIRSALGAGGMGEVYLARDEKINRDVAIKVLPAAYAEDPERLRRFEQEAAGRSGAVRPPVASVPRNVAASMELPSFNGARIRVPDGCAATPCTPCRIHRTDDCQFKH